MKIFFTLLIVIISTTTSYSQEAFTVSTLDSNFHVYLLMGQSNMAGRGTIDEVHKSVNHPSVFTLNKDNEWVLAQHPLHFDKRNAGVGPGLAFAIKMAEQNSKVKIGVVPCAVGGTSIRVWQPNGFDSATQTHPYDDAVARINVAMKSGIIKGMLWHQGEADSKPAAAETYLPKLETLIKRVRTLCGNMALPVVAGELGTFKPQYQNINNQLEKLSSFVPFTAVATSEGLMHKGDTTHFDSESADQLGLRFAEKMMKLQKDMRSN